MEIAENVASRENFVAVYGSGSQGSRKRVRVKDRERPADTLDPAGLCRSSRRGGLRNPAVMPGETGQH